nr:7861_t:CDS:2 [Entrophospora candida]
MNYVSTIIRIKLVVDKTAIPLAEFAISHFVALEEHFKRIAKNFKYRSGQFTPPTQMSFMCKLPDTPQASISTLPVDSTPQSIPNTISSQQAPSEIYEKLNFHHQKAIVANTKKSTQNWVIKAYKSHQDQFLAIQLQ